MASVTEARETPVAQLWDEIDDIHAGMLGLEGEAMHMQPMAPHVDRETNTIWFFTKKDTELVQKLRPGSRAHFCVVGKDHDYYACLSGTVVESRDPSKIEEYWSSMVAAWYHNGKADPALTMLALKVDDGEIWASTGNSLRFGWEIAKANFSDEKTPDVGVHQHLSFSPTLTKQ